MNKTRRLAQSLLALAVVAGLSVGFPVTASAAPPPAPSNLKATANAASVSLSWTNNHNNPSAAIPGAKIEIQRDDGHAWAKIGGDRPAASTDYVDHSVTAGTKYTYQLRVYIPGLGWSGLSSSASATPGPKVKVSITGWNPGAATATKTVNVTSNTSWTVTLTNFSTTDKTWLTTSKKSGSGDASFKLTVKANTSTSQRVASVRVEAKNDTAGSTAFSFQVIQAGKAATPTPKATSTTPKTPSTTSKPPTSTSTAPKTTTTPQQTTPEATETTTEVDITQTPVQTPTVVETPTPTPTDQVGVPPRGGGPVRMEVLIIVGAAVLIALIAAGVIIYVVRSGRQQ